VVAGSVPVSPGEELAVYTDGVVEARRDGERFGRERLGSLLRRLGSPGETVQRVDDALDAFAVTVEDDAAMLVLRRGLEGELAQPCSRRVQEWSRASNDRPPFRAALAG
jgi:hypothetical protein